MTPDQRFLISIASVTSALYLIFVFVAGVIFGPPWVYRGAIVAMGLCYLCPLVQVMLPTQRVLAAVLFCASIMAGVAAGLHLIW
jgi:hypothetical protein